MKAPLQPPSGPIVVTGATSGIGRTCAEQAAARGLTVVAAGRRGELLDELGSGERGTIVPVVADCATDDGRAAVLAAVERLGTALAAVIHAAGDDLVKPFAETTAGDLDHLLAINLIAPFRLTQLLLPHLAHGAGIVFVGSISATRGRDRHAAYGATKAALIGLTANLAVELGPRARVNSVSPGATRTALLRRHLDDAAIGRSDAERERGAIADAARAPLGRIGEPAEVAVVALHLALEATAVTGVDVPVDVGYTAT